MKHTIVVELSDLEEEGLSFVTDKSNADRRSRDEAEITEDEYIAFVLKPVFADYGKQFISDLTVRLQDAIASGNVAAITAITTQMTSYSNN